MKKKTLMSWSSGKDSAWALYQLLQNNEMDVVGLFTTVNEENERVAMHGVRLELLQQQADALDLPLEIIKLPSPCDNDTYQKIMNKFIVRSQKQGIECMAFGDIFLEDVKAYREEQLKGTAIKAIFPLWGQETSSLAKTMLKGGIKAITTCIDKNKLPTQAVGQIYSEAFISDLSEDIDICGENGEFHTFVYDAPLFKSPISISIGESIEKGQFVFVDLYPSSLKIYIPDT